MLSSLSDLHGYVDKGQLTGELGGSLEYCHSQWIHHRTVSWSDTYILLRFNAGGLTRILSQAIENFAVTVKTTAQMLQKFGTDLAETELPNDIQCTKDLLVAHTDKHNNLKVSRPDLQHIPYASINAAAWRRLASPDVENRQDGVNLPPSSNKVSTELQHR